MPGTMWYRMIYTQAAEQLLHPKSYSSPLLPRQQKRHGKGAASSSWGTSASSRQCSFTQRSSMQAGLVAQQSAGSQQQAEGEEGGCNPISRSPSAAHLLNQFSTSFILQVQCEGRGHAVQESTHSAVPGCKDCHVRAGDCKAGEKRNTAVAVLPGRQARQAEWWVFGVAQVVPQGAPSREVVSPQLESSR